MLPWQQNFQITTIDLFSLYVLFSQYRSCNNTLESCFFQTSSYSLAYLRIIYGKTKGHVPLGPNLPRSRFLDVMQRSPKTALRDILKTAASKTTWDLHQEKKTYKLKSSIRTLRNDDGNDNKNGKKINRFRLAEQQLCMCITPFLSLRCTTTRPLCGGR